MILTLSLLNLYTYILLVLVEKVKLADEDIKPAMEEKFLERGEKLDTLELQAEELSFSAKKFMKAVSYTVC